MNVLVIGGGGREHAIVHALSRSNRVSRIHCCPGNAGTAALARNIDTDIANHKALIAAARDHNVDLTIVGPETPLCDGIVDAFGAAGLRIFGPSAAAARIEGDKAYAKRLMRVAHVPTADARVFERFQDARDYIATRETGLVVKAAGLAAGKGVFVCEDPSEAILVAERILVKREFGKAGNAIVVEERLKGEELSVFALVAGHTIFVLDTAQDHKSLLDGDRGPNTGGMGAYSPAVLGTPELIAQVEREILVPIVDALEQDGAPYRGVLYAGLMLTPGGPKVLEFNCRFGDPEAQVILPRLQSDIVDLFESVLDNRLQELDVRWSPKTAVGVVMASGGYPGVFTKGKVIEGLDHTSKQEDVTVFHSGTGRVEHLTVTNGGRVLCVTGLGDDVVQARDRAYRAVSGIRFEGAHWRHDIAAREIRRIASSEKKTPEEIRKPQPHREPSMEFRD